MPDEKYIQFIANYDDWVAVKKLKITPETDPLVVAEFLAGLTVSVDAKVEQNLAKIVDLKKLDAAISELGLGKGDVARTLEEINSRKISRVINEITHLEKFQKDEKKELAGFCIAYATRKALKECGIKADYSDIEIPVLKKLKRAKG